MRLPPVELYGAVLNTLSGIDSRRHSATLLMSRLAGNLTSQEAESLPNAIAGILPLLRSDLERLRFASELAVVFDLFELAHNVVELAVETHDRQLLFHAADLAANPAVDSSVRQRIVDFSLTMSEQQRAIQIRVDPSAVPVTSDEQRLQYLSWPGSRVEKTGFALPPVVVVDSGLRADLVFRMSVALIEAGATVRRLESRTQIPTWFGSETGLVCSEETRRRVREKFPEFPESQIIVPDGGDLPDRPRDQMRLIQRLQNALVGVFREPIRSIDVDFGIGESLWKPEVFTAGIYTTREAAFLAGAKSDWLYRQRKRNLLKSLDVDGPRWNFRDVVAVRVWQYFNSQSPKSVSPKIIGTIVDFTGAKDAVRLGVTADGKILVDSGTGFEDLSSGQRVFEDISIQDVDDTFRPFVVGDGRVPDLINATANSTLHPNCLHGTPHLTGYRIAAKDLASIHLASSTEGVLQAYPELQGVDYDDVVGVGRQLLALK
ncbi:hypothetical protein [Candidatus Poriferisodalis sp.]|uniref:hypothetical protein n=1 Tax=Candidatus Poriferisodalis sp. TaxID=3101277 RepID=UPI003B023B19